MSSNTLSSSSHIIHLSKHTHKDNPENQISLGHKLKNYIKSYFSPPVKTHKRVVTLLEEAVFLMFSRLRNKNLKQKQNKTFSEEVERVIEPTSLDFKWLHPLEFRKGMASSLLRVENSASKERGYLLEA